MQSHESPSNPALPSGSWPNREEPSSVSAPAGQIARLPANKAAKQTPAWICRSCSCECVPIRDESRCLCGHRLRQHSDCSRGFRCSESGCSCKRFFFIMAEGCSCNCFTSPFVCNCDHPWSEHHQVIREKKVLTLDEMVAKHAGCQPGDIAAAADLGPAPDVNRWDLIKRGQHAAIVPACHGQSSHTRIEEL
ncbi:hypothetical protein WJX74_005857 [Apatococcus lobatus]|uniref:Protein FAM221A n=1 Tax=Apatococcus lobatus TaxID=904363 RepID=A0AAW1QTD5_9CHLO